MRIIPVTKNLQSLTEERHLTARTIESNVTVYSADNLSTPSDDATDKLLKLTNPKGYPVKPISTLQYLQLANFSTPACDRKIYKLIKQNSFRSIIEFGLEDGNRCISMLKVAQKYVGSMSVRYTGVDSFDARSEAECTLPLIQIHRELQKVDAKTQLVPGDIATSIPRIANSHVRTDLIVISAGFDPAALENSWFYFPRMLHSSSVVLVQKNPTGAFETLNRHQIEKITESQAYTRRIAA